VVRRPMALISLYWAVSEVWVGSAGLDLHLLPGLTSPRLDHLLWLRYTDKVCRADNPQEGVTVMFAAAFMGAPRGFGITMSPTSGEITVDATLPSGPRPRSFLVTATASAAGGSTQSARTRIYVHDHVTALWLTPNPLTIRQGAEDARLSLLAQFDDGVIGDITNWSPDATPAETARTYVHESGSSDPLLVWSSEDPAVISVDDTTGVLDAKAVSGSTAISVHYPPPSPVTGFAKAVVKCAPPWRTPVRLAKVAGPGFQAMDTARNILLLPDGFQDTPDDRAGFERLVRGVVSRLRLRQKTRPFDLLKNNFNYFMAWVPSPNAGISVLNELDQIASAGPITARSIEPPSRTRSAKWTLADLIAEVGLPSPAIDLDNSPLGTAESGRLKDWQTIYGPQVTEAQVTPELYHQWLAYNDRVLLNEQDTAFHIAISVRPQADPQDPDAFDRSLTMQLRRIQEDDLDDFINALQDDTGGPLPKVWARGGRDEDLVVFLCRSNHTGGTNSSRVPSGHVLALSMNRHDVHRIVANQDGESFDIDPDPIPRQIHPDIWGTVAHELAHSWNLGDEYGGTRRLTNDHIKALDNIANLQPRTVLLDGAGNLVSDKLKWRWPRIAKAGVLTGAPAATGGSFKLLLKPGHAFSFAIGDIVRLRTWPLLAAALSLSDRCRVVSTAGDELEVTVEPGGHLLPATFPAGSVVICPVRAPDIAPDVLGPDLELVAASTRARIDETHNPLNAKGDDPKNRPCVSPPESEWTVQTPATNYTDQSPRPNPPLYSAWIVGAYEQGYENNCEVVRPTGICLMRQISFSPTQRTSRAYQFCPICRYAIVDLFDPSQHGKLDIDFAPRYPK
jgi:hypothetical protein